MISVSIPNLPKFQKALKKTPELAAKYFKDAFEQSLLQIERETKPLVPVDTGRLRASFGKTGTLHSIWKIQKTSATIGSDVEYAVAVHEGNQRHRLGQRKFLEVGVQKATSKIKQFFLDAYQKVFNDIARDTNY